MSTPIKTNPAFAALAYRKTVLTNTVAHLRREYIGLDTEPKSTMLCEDVFQVDSKVPIAEVGFVVEDLIEEIEELKLEMAKFEFTKREHVSKRRKARKSKSKAGKGKQPEESDPEDGEG
jgi:hypothetical protein